MGVLGKLASAVVRSGATLLRRGASDASRRGVSRVAAKEYKSLRPGPVLKGRPATKYNRTGVKSSDYETGRSPLIEGSSSSLLDGESSKIRSGGSFGRTGETFKGKTDAPALVTKKTTRGPEALRRASVVGRRYFTQGTAGRGLNMKRAIPAAAAATAVAAPISYGLGSGALAIQRKFKPNAQETPRSQQVAQTYQEGADKLASQSSATATGAIPGSSASSASTDKASGTTASTSSVGGLLGPEMKASAAAVRPDRAGGADRDYMGEAFDATLRKGVTSGRAYLKQQLASTKADSKKTQTLLDKYDRSVGKDTLLGRDRGVGYLKNSDSDQTQKDLLATYRGRFGQYRKNASATEIEAMAQAAAAKRGK